MVDAPSYRWALFLQELGSVLHLHYPKQQERIWSPVFFLGCHVMGICVGWSCQYHHRIVSYNAFGYQLFSYGFSEEVKSLMYGLSMIWRKNVSKVSTCLILRPAIVVNSPGTIKRTSCPALKIWMSTILGDQSYGWEAYPVFRSWRTKENTLLIWASHNSLQVISVVLAVTDYRLGVMTRGLCRVRRPPYEASNYVPKRVLTAFRVIVSLIKVKGTCPICGTACKSISGRSLIKTLILSWLAFILWNSFLTLRLVDKFVAVFHWSDEKHIET